MTVTKQKTIIDCIIENAKKTPEKRALKFFNSDYQTEESLTYSELIKRIQKYASILKSKLSKDVDSDNNQKNILLIFNSGLEYITSFLAVLYLGHVAVAAYPPQRRRHLKRLMSIINDSQSTLIITNQNVIQFCRENDFKLECPAGYLSIDEEVKSHNKFLLEPTKFHLNNTAFLQYTSGSTGTPKGVIVSHKNILANLEFLTELIGKENTQCCVSWLPIFHDMGLIGNTLLPLFNGGCSTFMDPLTFLKKPAFWFQKISTEQATYVMAPNFSYNMAAKQLEKDWDSYPYDFQKLSMLINGSEPIKVKTIQRLEAILSKLGAKDNLIHPGYGMAEATLAVGKCSSLNRWHKVDKYQLELGKNLNHHASGEQVNLVKCAALSRFYDVQIVNPETLESCPRYTIGEIWLAGDSVTNGYYNNPKETERVFKAYTANTGQGPYLRTGDLGYLDEEDQIIICGRKKDLMIINGRNIYPQDIEDITTNSDQHVQEHGAAAFSIEVNGTESVVIIAEVKQDLKKEDYQRIIYAIRWNVYKDSEINIYDIVLIPPRTLLKTSSGKVQRSACKKNYQNNLFEQLYSYRIYQKQLSHKVSSQSVQVDNINQWLINWISIYYDMKHSLIDINKPFVDFGLNSVGITQMFADLENYLGKPVKPWLAWEFPNIAQLSHALSNKQIISNKIASEKTSEPIAVIGMDCKIPGFDDNDIDGIDAFWSFLKGDKDNLKPVPIDRWDNRLFYNKDNQVPGTLNSTEGGFFKDVKSFDAKFFNISPREAEYLDPQHRLALSVIWRALENAGILPNLLRGSNTSVFLGISSHDYLDKMLRSLSFTDISPYQGTGNSFATASGRISYFLDVKGPSMAIDTACSSSLVCIHEACDALNCGETDMAIVSGVNTILSPENSIIFCKSGMLSPDNRCKTFDDSANGYVRGEGCGAVVLKRLSDAIKDDNQIYAVIHGTAVNQDGQSNGLTAPNLLSQVNVMQKALDISGIPPQQIGHIEAHGTGTSLGDPIEWEGIRRVYGNNRDEELTVTSVKTRIGHLEAAAGIAGFIKTVLAIYHQQIPPHLNFSKLNKNITKGEHLHIATKITDWVSDNRFAAVSSFGFSGTNAHVILGNHRNEKADYPDSQLRNHLWLVSAKDKTTLELYIKEYESLIKMRPEIEFETICRQALLYRDQFNYRTYIVASNAQEWLHTVKAKQYEINNRSEPVKLAWMFTGQGALQKNMATKLCEQSPIFAETMNHCTGIANQFLDFDLNKFLIDTPDNIDINDTKYAQITLFVFEYALAKWYMSLGIEPDILIGHSLGEYVAAALAEVMTLDDAIRLVCLRGNLMANLPKLGAMLALQTNDKETFQLLKDFDEISIAAINSPHQTVVSGPTKAIDKLLALCQDKHIKAQPLQTSHAFHSPLMQEMLAPFKKAAQQIEYYPPKIDVISNITGLLVEPDQYDAQYWCDHILSTVQFNQGMKSILEKNIVNFLEIGPKPVLSLFAMAHKQINPIPTIDDVTDPMPHLLDSIGKLFMLGCHLNGKALYQKHAKEHIIIPSYPFRGKIYWFPEPTSKENNLSSTHWRQNLYQLTHKFHKLTKPEKLSLKSAGIICRQPTNLNHLNKFKNKISDIVLFTSLDSIEASQPITELIYICQCPIKQMAEEVKFFYHFINHYRSNFSSIPLTFTYQSDCLTAEVLLGMLKSIKEEENLNLKSLKVKDIAIDFPWIKTIQQTDIPWQTWAFEVLDNQLSTYEITPLPAEKMQDLRQFYRDKTYLVTGASGGVGQIIVEMLLDNGVKHIAALGRKTGPISWNSTIQAKLKNDVFLDYYSCDVSDTEDLKSTLHTIRKKQQPITAIIHCAGISDDKLWTSTSLEDVEKTLSAKSIGALNLHYLTMQDEISEFICFSSISGLLGNQGQSAYAGANAFLDALCQWRQQNDLPGLSLIAGPIQNTGLFAQNGIHLDELMQLKGIRPVKPELIKKLFKYKYAEPQLISAEFSKPPKVAFLEKAHAIADKSENIMNKNFDLASTVSKLLKVDQGELKENDDWFSFGMDSILATQLANIINNFFNTSIINAIDVLENATIQALSTILETKQHSLINTQKNPDAKKTKSLPLSLQQQEIWNFLKNSKNHLPYLIPVQFKIDSTLKVDEFIHAIQKVCSQHQIFNLAFHEYIGQVYQYIQDDYNLEINYYDSINENIVNDLLTNPFDLSTPPLIRTAVFKTEDGSYLWITVFNHLICDGVTVKKFVEDVFSVLDGHFRYQNTIQFSQFIDWQWQHVYPQLHSNLLDFWKKNLAGYPLDINLPKTQHKMAAKVSQTTLNLDQINQTNILNTNHVSINHYILACLFHCLMERFNRKRQGLVVFFSGREDNEFSAVYGDTTNDVVITCAQEKNILTMASQLREKMKQLYPLQYMRLPILKQNNLPTPMISYDFQALKPTEFSKNHQVHTVQYGNIQQLLWGDNPRALSFKVMLSDDRLIFSLKYRTDLVSDNDASQLLETWLETVKKPIEINGTTISSYHSFKLSVLQKNLWKLMQDHPTQLPYQIPIIKKLTPSIDLAMLERVINLSIAQNANLRLKLEKTNSDIKLNLEDHRPICINKIKANNHLVEIGRVISEKIPDKEFPLQAYCISSNDNRYFMLKIHHLVCDGISSEILWQEMESNYKKLVAGESIANKTKLTDLEYISANQLNAYDYSGYKKRICEYYYKLTEKIESKPSNLHRKRPFYYADIIYEILPQEFTEEIKNYCLKFKISQYSFYLSLFSKTISLHYHLKQVYISIVKSNRILLPQRDLIGYYADNIPVLLEIYQQEDFLDFCKRAQKAILSVIDKYPYSILTDEQESCGYLQPHYLFNHFSTSTNENLFEDAGEVFKDLISVDNKIAVWNYKSAEPIYCMVRGNPSGDIISIIYDAEYIKTDEVRELIKLMILIIRENYSR